uniref:Uncharacterized protein n=1 Tax=Nothoprocta perdicaria TaxID=30464 RepID=A0A8C6ZNU2_NOTPE
AICCFLNDLILEIICSISNQKDISREGDSTTSLGSLCQGSGTLTVKKFLHTWRWNCLCFNLYPLPLVLSLATNEKSLAPSSLHSPFMYSVSLPWIGSWPGAGGQLQGLP